MKIVDCMEYKKKEKSPDWLLTFFIGIIFGGFVVWWNKEQFVQDSYFLGEEVFQRFGYTSIYKTGFFYYICKNRLELFLFLVLSSFTNYIGSVFYFTILWFGICGGVIGSTLLLKFGLKGLLLLFGLFFPHICIYVPCFIVLMKFLFQFRDIRAFSKNNSWDKKCTINRRILIFLVMILCFIAVMIVGVWIESYVNPIVLKNITSFFW